MKKFCLILIMFCSSASAQVFTSVPYVFRPNTAVVPGQLMTNFLSLVASGNAVASNLNSKITALSSIPTGALVFFNLGSCPSGWAISPILNQLFIRGVDNGAGNDTTGTVLGFNETGGMQDHTHQTNPLFTGITGSPIFSAVALANSFNNFTTGTNQPTGIGSTGFQGSEVRPANVSLLLCSKN